MFCCCTVRSTCANTHYLNKTSWYPFESASSSVRVLAKMSAVIAEASPAQTRALSIHFERVGITFQIIDDVRDIRGSSYGGADIMDDQNATDNKPVLKRRGEIFVAGNLTSLSPRRDQ